MSEKSLFVCLDCHGFFSGEQEKSDCRKCPQCGGDAKKVELDYVAYCAMPTQEKAKFCKEYAAKHCRKKPDPFTPMPDSKMAKCVGCMGAVLIGLAFLGGAVALITGGIIAGISLLLGGLVSGGILYVLSNVAEDVRHTRNQIDRLMHERKYRK